jgi:hypothetical protein
MKVYGNGNLRLYQPLLNLEARVVGGGYLSGQQPEFFVDGLYAGSAGTSGRVIASRGASSVSVSDVPGYVFSHFVYENTIYSGRVSTFSIIDGLTLTAYFEPSSPQNPLRVGGSVSVCPVALAAASEFKDHYNVWVWGTRLVCGCFC